VVVTRVGGREVHARVGPAPSVPSAPTGSVARRRWRARRRGSDRHGLGRAALPVGLVGVVVACVLPWQRATRMGLSGDVFWHLAAGQWMVAHHAVLTRDVFSYTVTGHPWHTPEWGFEVGLAEGVHLLGPVAYWLASAGLATVTVVLVAWRSRLAGAGWIWTGLLAFEAGMALTMLLADRPQMVSYALFAGLLVVLALARRRTRWLWVVPPLFVLWTNVHGSFLLGLGVVGLEAVLALWPAQWPAHVGRVAAGHTLPVRPAMAALAGAAGATLVNPFGTGVYRAAFGVAFNPQVRQLISEWQSPDFHGLLVPAVVLLPLLFVVAHLALSGRSVPAGAFVLYVVLLVATLQSARFIPYAAIAWCALAASLSPLQHEQLRPSLLVWPVAGLLGLSMLAGPWVRPGTPASSIPVRAVALVRHSPGHVFSTYVWNDYLLGQHIPVFVDGRTELYTADGVLTRYLEVDAATVDPDAVLLPAGVTDVLWPRHSALATVLARDPLWHVRWRSASAVLFERAGVPAGARSAPGAAPVAAAGGTPRPVPGVTR